MQLSLINNLPEEATVGMENHMKLFQGDSLNSHEGPSPWYSTVIRRPDVTGAPRPARGHLFPCDLDAETEPWFLLTMLSPPTPVLPPSLKPHQGWPLWDNRQVMHWTPNKHSAASKTHQLLHWHGSAAELTITLAWCQCQSIRWLRYSYSAALRLNFNSGKYFHLHPLRITCVV